jgi:hypothetical protein
MRFVGSSKSGGEGGWAGSTRRGGKENGGGKACRFEIGRCGGGCAALKGGATQNQARRGVAQAREARSQV